MITEDYVSFEVAKLLKEKGFDGECDYLYVNGNIVRAQGYRCNWNKGETIFADYKNECSAPTLQLAMKWLREVHKWHIEISRGEYGYFVHIVSAKNLSTENYTVQLEGGYNLSYEEACEAAIRYCLENLI